MNDTAAPHGQTVIIVGAIAEDRVAGSNGRLPWHAPDDLRHFRDLTLGHPVIMGQRTWQGLTAPLAGRSNIVLSNDPIPPACGVVGARSFPQALTCAGAGLVFVIGGRRPWEEALPVATEIRLTRIHARFPGDVFFPPIDATTWAETDRVARTGLVSGVLTRIEFLAFTRRDSTPDPRLRTRREQP